MSKLSLVPLTLAAALLLSPRPAAAADPVGDLQDKGPIGVDARAGIAGYSGGLADYTGAGVGWSVAGVANPSERWGFEAAYVGSRIPVDDFRSNGSIVSNGLEGLAKLYGRDLVTVEGLDPYVGAGVGFSFVTPSGTEGDIFGGDTLAQIPLAAGIEYNIGNVAAGVRLSWSNLIGESFANDADPDEDPNGGLLQGLLQVGGRF